MERVTVAASRVLAILSALSIVVLMLAIAADVTVRFISKASLPGMLEVAETSLVVAVFFGIAWAGVQGEHVAVTLVTDRLSARANALINVGVWGMSSLFLGWMFYATSTKALDATVNLEERFGLVRWPLYPARWVIALGIAAFLLVAVLNFVRALRGRPVLGEDSTAHGNTSNVLAQETGAK